MIYNRKFVLLLPFVILMGHSLVPLGIGFMIREEEGCFTGSKVLDIGIEVYWTLIASGFLNFFSSFGGILVITDKLFFERMWISVMVCNCALMVFQIAYLSEHPDSNTSCPYYVEGVTIVAVISEMVMFILSIAILVLNSEFCPRTAKVEQEQSPQIV